MYSSEALGIFTKLCNHHHCLIPEHFIILERNPVPISHHFPTPRSQWSTFCLEGFADFGYFT